jgi:hypothetical protein
MSSLAASLRANRTVLQARGVLEEMSSSGDEKVASSGGS